MGIVARQMAQRVSLKLKKTGIFLVVSSGLEKEKRKIQKQRP